MDQNPPAFKIRKKDEARLAYIHSNKFITLKSFHRKFFKNRTEVAAWYQLEKFIKSTPPYIERVRGNHFEQRYYILKSTALRFLDEKGLILVRDPNKQVKLRSETYDHDTNVTAIRVAFEENPELKNVFWVSDHEIRCGISPEVKAKFMEGVLNKVSWRFNRPQEVFAKRKKDAPQRTPDAYFEADFNGSRTAFTLEYIHKPYNRAILDSVIFNLKTDPLFGKSFRLVVCRDKEQAANFIPKIKARVKDKDKWFVGYYDMAVKEPFSKIWFNLAKA